MKKVYEDKVERAENLKDQLLKAREKVGLDKLKKENNYELVKEFDGKVFINDSNATDLNACMAAIEQQAGNVIWINYAPPIESDLKQLKKLVDSKVKAMFCFGEGVENVFSSFMDHVEFFVKIESVEEGIILANNYAQSGDVILFSPGVPNYKFFENTSDWNSEFNLTINSLKKED